MEDTKTSKGERVRTSEKPRAAEVMTLRERREDLGWSVRGMAELCHLSPPTILKIEANGTTAEDRPDHASRRRSWKRMVEALDRGERKRDEYGVEAHNRIARGVASLETLVERGALSPGEMVLCLGELVAPHADELRRIDPGGAAKAKLYQDAILKGRIGYRRDTN